MGQNVTIAGASYLDVPALDVPKTGGGTARFVDTADDTVTPATLKLGVTAHDASGAKITGEMTGDLPDVTAADNGKFLRVVDGAWAATDGETSDALILQSAPEWEIGGINETTGEDQTRTDRLRSGDISLRNLMSVSFDTLKLTVLAYNGDAILGNVYGGYVDIAIDADYIREQYPAATKIRLVAKNAAGTGILPGDAASVMANMYRSNTYIFPEIDALKSTVEGVESSVSGMLYTIKNLTWEQGMINSTTGLDADSTSRIRCGYIDFANVVKITVTQNARINIFAFDARKNKIGFTDWLAANATKTVAELEALYPGIAYIRLLALTGNVSDGGKIEVTVYAVNDSIADFKEDMLEKTNDVYRFDEKFQVIAYSNIGVAPINTKEHFEYCAKHGFDGLKCDVRLTSDDKLVLCHDAGVTLDSEGRITGYSASNSTTIRSMTSAEFLALEHATKYNDAYVHPTDLESFMTICKRSGKIPYITVRGATDSTEDGTLAPTVAKLVAEAIRKYSVERNCIVNSYDPAILLMIRAREPEVYLSQVFYPYNSMLLNAAMKNAKENSLYMLCFFFEDASHTYDSMVADANIMAAITECKARGIRVWGAQTTSENTLDKITALGFGGTHHKQPLADYT